MGHESAAEWANKHSAGVELVQPGTAAASAYSVRLPPEGLVLDEVEMSLVLQALERSNGNQTRAAELLGISRDQLRLKKLDEAAAE